uniref:Uncharacterized protein n=1 Tax=Arundo donax TaxID=35708 RepID=A0A0A9BAQ3_ARUDO
MATSSFRCIFTHLKKNLDHGEKTFPWLCLKRGEYRIL